MTIATRIDADMGHWMPVTRLYAVDGGHLAVTVANFLTATGTTIHYCDEQGIAVGDTMQSLADFPDGTTHNEALELLGYTVIDDIGDEPLTETSSDITPQEQSIIDMLPPEIAQMITNTNQETP